MNPEVVEKTEFSYSELSDKAKAYARQTHVEQPYFLADEWWDMSFEHFMRIAPLLGITIDTKSVRTYGGGKKDEPNIIFSGFCSQGDGANFVGSYRYEPDAAGKILEHAPQDKELLRIATELTALQVGVMLEHGGTFGCSVVRGNSHYSHSGCMDVTDATIDNAWFVAEDSPDTAEQFEKLLRDFADWMYARLEAEYDYMHSDEYLAQDLQDETFDEDGSII